MFDFFQNLLSKLTENGGKKPPKPNPQQILADLQPQIEATAKTIIQIKTSVSPPSKLENSKFGGLPYFPVNQAFPTSTDEKPMRLLAQLNFAEMPNLSPYPTEGLLQFYIAENDDIHGLDFDNPTKQENWRVLFFDSLDFEARTDLADLYPSEWKYSPILKSPLSLQFEIAKDYPSYPSLEYYRDIEPLFEKKIEDEDQRDLVIDAYLDGERSMGHKIGGHPYYTQNEVREYKDEYRDFELLFQMDSDGDKIMWGDVGVANFFIRREDLLKRNFSKVLYNWDCH